MERKYGIGLDIGIGSVGYAVISRTNNLDARIEDIGVRLFDSGENIRQKASNAQERRGYRSTRRLLRRRKHRKERIKKFFLKIKLMNEMQLKAWQEQNGNQNVLQTRIKGLNEKLTPEEILDCIIHICNRRGYREFYGDDSKKDNADKDELQKIEGGLASFDEIYQSGGYKSVAEMLINDSAFRTETSFVDYRNHKNAERYILIKREFVKKELEDILNKQSEYYPQLTANNIRIICDDMVFAQRDFETGPGNEDDKTRRFMGFIDSIGQCMYYKDEKRAYRSTVIADIYALVNCLSQLSFVNTETGEILLPENVAKEIIDTALTNASITENDIKNILKQNKLEMRKPGKLEVTVPDTIKTLKTLKAVLTNAGYKYEELIKENQFDINNPSKLHQLCLLLSENITPARRIRALKAKGWNEKLQKEVIRKKFGGTASVCEKYMVEAIEAFKRGETYGNFQARMLKEREDALPDIEKQKYLAPFDKKIDEELVKNIVVFKAVNETRKILNELIRRYGSPEYINIEVADDLGRSFKERAKIIKRINDNKKEKDKMKDGLEKTRTGFWGNIMNTLTGSKIDDDLYDELEEQLILADVGGEVAIKLVDKLRDRVLEKGLKTGEEAADALRDIIAEEMTPDAEMDLSGKPAVILVIGVNGVGKTTLSRCLCGLLKEQAGQILLNGKPLNRKGRQRSAFCVMQDVNHQLFSDSVWGECQMSAPDAPDQTIEKVLDSLHLLPFRERHPMSLSGGQKQRLAGGTRLLL